MAPRNPVGRMERARLAAGLSIEEVAVHMRRCTVSVRRWETGRTMPPQSALLELARLLDATPEELID